MGCYYTYLFLMHAVPGGPFTAEKKLPPAVLTAVEARYKLNDPLWKQYTDYLGHVVQGDFGPSFKYPGRTVNNIIAETAPVLSGIRRYQSDCIFDCRHCVGTCGGISQKFTS